MQSIYIVALFGLLFGCGFALGATTMQQSNYIGYDEKKKEWDKGYKLGLRKGKEESEKQLVEKLKKL